MEKYAIFLDLDGTLLNSKKELTRRNYDALARAAERGAYIVPTTGRIYMGMPYEIRSLPFVRYTVNVNGAEVYDAAEKRVLHAEEIEPGRAQEIFDILKTFDGLYDCYAEGRGYMPRDCYERIDDYIFDPLYNRMVHELREPVDDFSGFIAGRFKSVQKIQIFFCDMAERARAFEILTRTLTDCAVTSSVPTNIEINSARANKGEALLFLCSYLGVPVKNAVAFGDGINDLSMLRSAGTGVAMANADADIKAAADAVTASCDEDGVAAFLEAFFA